MFGVRPLVALSWSAPALDEIARRVELDDRGRWWLAFHRAHDLAWTRNDPYMIVRIDSQATHRPQRPFVRNRGPGRINLEGRDLTPWHGLLGQSGIDLKYRKHQKREARCQD